MPSTNSHVQVGPTLDDRIAAVDTLAICVAQDKKMLNSIEIQKDLDARLKKANIAKAQYDNYQLRLLSDPNIKALQLKYYKATCNGTSIS